MVFRDVAQFGRALRSGRKGSRFKSCHPDFLFRGVAQLVARLLWEQDVGGSSPFTPIFLLSKNRNAGGFSEFF